MGFSFGPEDGLNINLHLDLDNHPISDGGKTREQTRSPSRACMSDMDSSFFVQLLISVPASPLSEVPLTPPADVEMEARDIGCRKAGRVICRAHCGRKAQAQEEADI